MRLMGFFTLIGSLNLVDVRNASAWFIQDLNIYK